MVYFDDRKLLILFHSSVFSFIINYVCVCVCTRARVCVCLLRKGNFLFLNIIKTFLYIIFSVISKLGHSPPTIDFCIWSEIEVDVHLFPEGYQKTAAFRERLPFATALACVSICVGLLLNPLFFVLLFFPIYLYLQTVLIFVAL